MGTRQPKPHPTGLRQKRPQVQAPRQQQRQQGAGGGVRKVVHARQYTRQDDENRRSPRNVAKAWKYKSDDEAQCGRCRDFA